jgi:hypothetical protein
MVKLKNKLINIFYIIMMMFSFLAFYGTLYEIIESFNYIVLIRLISIILFGLWFTTCLIDNLKGNKNNNV